MNIKTVIKSINIMIQLYEKLNKQKIDLKKVGLKVRRIFLNSVKV